MERATYLRVGSEINIEILIHHHCSTESECLWTLLGPLTGTANTFKNHWYVGEVAP